MEKGEEMTDAMTMLQDAPPRHPMFTPGQELGLDSWNRETAEEEDSRGVSLEGVFLASKMRHQESILVWRNQSEHDVCH